MVTWPVRKAKRGRSTRTYGGADGPRGAWVVVVVFSDGLLALSALRLVPRRLGEAAGAPRAACLAISLPVLVVVGVLVVVVSYALASFFNGRRALAPCGRCSPRFFSSGHAAVLVGESAPEDSVLLVHESCELPLARLEAHQRNARQWRLSRSFHLLFDARDRLVREPVRGSGRRSRVRSFGIIIIIIINAAATLTTITHTPTFSFLAPYGRTTSA